MNEEATSNTCIYQHIAMTRPFPVSQPTILRWELVYQFGKYLHHTVLIIISRPETVIQ